MYASRSAARASRALRVAKNRSQTVRFQSTGGPSPASSGAGSGALTGGVAGGATALAVGYAWYYFSGAKTAVSTLKTTQNYAREAQEKFKKEVQDKAPSPNEALKWLRQVSNYYAGFVPGASGYVNTAFDDIDKIHDKHGEEVDKIVSEAYDELKGLSQKGGFDIKTATQAFDILQKHTKRIFELAGDAAQDILDNHPEIKEKVGGNLDQLKELGQKYGPEAQKEVDRTWDQIKDVINSGISADTGNKIRKIVEEKVQKVKEIGDEAWKKGMEKAKPYLDKNPEVKKVVEENADALKSGNLEELYNKVKEAAESGKTEELQKYVKNATDKAQKSVGGGLDQYLKKIPGGDQVISKLGQLNELAQKKGPEAQKLLEDTIKEVSDVLSKKSDEAKKLAEEK